jgi:hypothetical protein
MHEQIMSLTGSVIAKKDQVNRTIRVDPLPAILTWDQFLNGGIVSVYFCDFIMVSSKCEEPTVLTNQTIIGMRAHVEGMLLGSAGNPGIIDLLNAKGLQFNAGQQAFVQAMPGGVLAHLQRLAIEPQVAKSYAQYVAELVAVEMTANLVWDTVRAARLATVGRTADTKLTAFLEELEKTNQRAQQARIDAADRMAGMQRMLEVSHMLRANISQAGAAQRAGMFSAR